MTLLLEKRGAHLVITEEVVKEAAGNGYSGENTITLLLVKRREQVVITEKVVQPAARNRQNRQGIIALLLEKQGADVVTTDRLMNLIAEGFSSRVTTLSEKRGDDCVAKEEVVKASIPFR